MNESCAGAVPSAVHAPLTGLFFIATAPERSTQARGGFLLGFRRKHRKRHGNGEKERDWGKRRSGLADLPAAVSGGQTFCRQLLSLFGLEPTILSWISRHCNYTRIPHTALFREMSEILDPDLQYLCLG
ncbi:hypothetical protein KM043_004080 [Ampulex compressa]|nr:hypothetical protein KM043_004080 [Ampulex compressa]